jgi:hypothetical protein
MQNAGPEKTGTSHTDLKKDKGSFCEGYMTQKKGSNSITNLSK